jgi:hypothetical protein
MSIGVKTESAPLLMVKTMSVKPLEYPKPLSINDIYSILINHN